MRIAIVSTALLFAVVGQDKASAFQLHGTVTDEVELERLSMAWMQAVENKDRPTLDALMAPDYSLQMPGVSKRTTRDEWIANAIKKEWSSFRYEHLVARVDGDRATVTSRLYFKVAPIPVTLDAGIVDTWARRDGRWQVTGRYLGDSVIRKRVAFILGLLTAVLFAGAGFVLRRLVSRMRTGAA